MDDFEQSRRSSRPNTHQSEDAAEPDLDTTTLYVTHDEREAMTMDDRIAVMSEGRVMQFKSYAGPHVRARSTATFSFCRSPSVEHLQQPSKLQRGGVVGCRLACTAVVQRSLQALSSSKFEIGIRPNFLRLGALARWSFG